MSIAELIQNAKECARDTIVYLEAAEKLSCAHEKLNALGRAYGNMKTGAEEINRAHRDAKAALETEA